MGIKEVKCKSALTKSNLPEVDYCINPYIGCMHSCVYCYACFMKRFTGHANENWGDFIDIKINSPETIKKEINKLSNKNSIIIGSVTDAYQKIEEKFKITRQILEIILEKDLPISILTKSKLVERDIDLFKKFSDCEIGLTITTTNDNDRVIFEPRASQANERINTLKKLKQAGIKTYVFIGPILPGITNLEKIFKKISGYTDFIMAESLNTKVGDWNKILEIIKKYYPEYFNFYKDKFNKEYWIKVEEKTKKLSDHFNIPLKGFYNH